MFQDSATELYVLPRDGAYDLTWSTRVFSNDDGHVYRVFIDALTGNLIWRYDDTAFHFYELSAGDYHPVAESRALAGLTPMMLTVAMEQSKTDGQSAALRRFRARLPPPAR